MKQLSSSNRLFTYLLVSFSKAYRLGHVQHLDVQPTSKQATHSLRKPGFWFIHGNDNLLSRSHIHPHPKLDNPLLGQGSPFG